MDFNQIFNESLFLMQEGLEFINGEDVYQKLISGMLAKAIGIEEIPEFYKKNKETVISIFDATIKHIKNFNKNFNEVQPVLLMLKKAKSIDELKQMSELKDTLIEFARTSNTDFKKSPMYKKITKEPFSIELWHSFEKAAQGYVDKSTHQASESKYTYGVLFDNGEWKLFIPHSFEDDSHLAGGMEKFECINFEGKQSVTEKAQWCTAAREDYYKHYSSSGNHFYIAKHYLPNGKCDEAFQAAFCGEDHIEIKDKFDMDSWNNSNDELNETHLSYLFEKAPAELLAKIVNDNPECENKNSLLDYVNFCKSGKKFIDIDDVIFCSKESLNDYANKGYYLYTKDSNRIPSFAIKVVIDRNVTSIDDYVFRFHENLTSISIPNSVTKIGNSAFMECTSLTNITIPDSVTTIGDWAFNWCSGLTSITIPDSVTKIGNYAFRSCLGLTNITIGSNVTFIGNYAFDDCSNLTNITISANVDFIGYSAFGGCTSLTNVTISEGVTTIGCCAFQNCTSLTSITIPDSVTEISSDAFNNCTSLTSINIPNNVTEIYNDTFYNCTSLTSITIPDRVNTIDDYAFNNCPSLVTINYKGTKEQWDEIDKDTNWGYNIPNNCVINYNYKA